MLEITAGHNRFLNLLADCGTSRKEPFGYTVGIYNQVINIRCRETEHIVSLLAKEGGEEPWALKTNAPSFSELLLQEGIPVWMEDGQFLVGNYRFQANPGLTTYEVAPWICVPDKGLEYRQSVAEIKKIVEEYDRITASKAAYEPKLSQLCATVSQSVKTGKWAAASQAGKDLVGLGPGLTPSGDDWLTGFQAAVCLHGHPLQEDHRLNWADEWFAGICAYAQGRTTELSLEFLRRAQKRLFGSRLRAVLESICQNKEMKASVDALIRTGSTSGLDTAKGLLAGLLLDVDID